MNIRLIASDIDGTLLPYGGGALEPELFSLIRALGKRGIVFCAASGRQYSSLRRLFAPVADEIYYLCENGALVADRGPSFQVLHKTVMPQPDAGALIAEILARAECEVLISGANTSYVIPKRVDMERRMREFTGNHTMRVARAEDVPEEVIKISAYCPDASALAPCMKPAWEKRFSVAVAGQNWLDFTLADKGTGLRSLCASLDVEEKAVLAFGDNYNDVPLFENAGTAYLMETAAPELLARWPRHCASVTQVMRELTDTVV